MPCCLMVQFAQGVARRVDLAGLMVAHGFTCRRKTVGRRPNWRYWEQWKPVKIDNVDEKRYSISNMGRVQRERWRSVKASGIVYIAKKRLMSIGLRDSSAIVCLRDNDGKAISRNVKTLVADSWLQPRTGARVILIDKSDPFDCSLSNIKEKGVQSQKAHRLTEEQVKEIKVALLTPYTGQITDLSHKYKISHQTISAIKRGKLWKEINIDK